MAFEGTTIQDRSSEMEKNKVSVAVRRLSIPGKQVDL